MAQRIKDFAQEDIRADTDWLNDVPEDAKDGQLDMILIEDPVKFDMWWAGKDGEWKGWKIEKGRPYVAAEDGTMPIEMIAESRFVKGQLNYNKDAYAFLVLHNDRVKVWKVTKQTLKAGLQVAFKKFGQFKEIRIIAQRVGVKKDVKYSVTPVEKVELTKDQTTLIAENYKDLEELFSPKVYNAPTEKSGTYQQGQKELTDEDIVGLASNLPTLFSTPNPQTK
jgi:hypothetical protein